MSVLAAVAEAIRSRGMTCGQLRELVVRKCGYEPRVINAFDGAEVKVGGRVRLPAPPGATDGALFLRFEDGAPAIARADGIGVWGIFKEAGEEKRVPLPFSFDHPRYPGELILFVPT